MLRFLILVEILGEHHTGKLETFHRSQDIPVPMKHTSSADNSTRYCAHGLECVVDVTAQTFDEIVMDNEKVRKRRRGWI